MPISVEEAYVVLGLESGASEDEVRRCYKKLALRTHPDKNPDDPHAHKKFLQISEAYKRITDPDSFKDEEEGEEPSEEEMEAMFNMMFAEMMGFGGGQGLPAGMFDMFEAMMMDGMDEDEAAYYYYGEDGDEDDEDEDDEDDEYYYGGEGDEDDDDMEFFMQGGSGGAGMMEAMLMEALMQEQFGMGGMGGMSGMGRGMGRGHPAISSHKGSKKKPDIGKTQKKNEKAPKGKAKSEKGKKKEQPAASAATSQKPTSKKAPASVAAKAAVPAETTKAKAGKRNHKDDSAEDDNDDGDAWETDDSATKRKVHAHKKQAHAAHFGRPDEEDAWEDEDDEEHDDMESMLQHMSEEQLMYLMMSGMMGGGGGGGGRGRGRGGPAGMMDLDMMEMLAGGMMGGPSRSTKGSQGKAKSHGGGKATSAATAAPSSSAKKGNGASKKPVTSKKVQELVSDDEDEDDDEAEPAIPFAGRGAQAGSSSSGSKKTSTTESSLPHVNVGDSVLVYGRHAGKVAFIGDVHYAKGTYVGVVMDDPSQGKNSGVVRGVEYFSCPRNRGLMVSLQDIKKA